MNLGRVLIVCFFVLLVTVLLRSLCNYVSKKRYQKRQHDIYCFNGRNCMGGNHGLYPASGGWTRLIPEKIETIPTPKPKKIEVS